MTENTLDDFCIYTGDCKTLTEILIDGISSSLVSEDLSENMKEKSNKHMTLLYIILDRLEKLEDIHEKMDIEKWGKLESKSIFD